MAFLSFFIAPLGALIAPFLAGVTVVAALTLIWLLWPLPARFVGLLATLAILAVWGLSLMAAADRQPVAARLDAVKIAASQSRVVLGRQMLFQNRGAASADEAHVELSQAPLADAGGDPLAAWSVANVSTRRNLLLVYCARPTDRQGGPDRAFEACRRTHADKTKMLASRLPLAAGDVVELSSETGATQELTILSLNSGLDAAPAANGGAITIGIGAVGKAPARIFTLHWRPGSFLLTDREGAAVPPCQADAWALPQAIGALSDRLRGATNETTLLHIGGAATCVRRGSAATIALDHAPFSAVTVGFVPDIGFVVARDGDPGAEVRRRDATTQPVRLFGLGSLQPSFVLHVGTRTLVLDSFIAGRTRYAVEPDAADQRQVGLTIVPIANSHRMAGFSCIVATMNRNGCADAADAGTEWRNALAFGSPAALRGVLPSSTVFKVAALVLALLLQIGLVRLGLIEAPHAPEWLMRCGFVVVATEVAVAYALLKYEGFGIGQTHDIPDAPWGALAIWGVAAVAVATARGGGPLDAAILAVTTAILALGHTALAVMSLEAGELSRLRFADDTTHVIAACGAAIILASQVGPRALAGAARSLVLRSRLPGLRHQPPGFLAVGGVTAVVLLLWFTFGSETGIANLFQPSEVIKTLVVLVLSAAITLALDRERGGGRDKQRAAPRPTHGLAWLVGALWRLAPAGAGAFILGVRALQVSGAGPEVPGSAGPWGLGLGASLPGLAWIWHLGLEAAGVVLVGVGILLVLRWIDDPMWSPFTLIVAILAAISFVPVFRNDLSAFLVIVATALISLIVVLVIHRGALVSEFLDTARLSPPAPPSNWRPPPPTPPPERFDVLLGRRLGRLSSRLGRGLRRRPFELAACLALFVMPVAASFGAGQLAEAGASRQYYVDRLGTGQGWDKTYNRMISWIEFNARPDRSGAMIPVEFADVGLQVLRSRHVLAQSRCDAWQDWGTPAAPADGWPPAAAAPPPGGLRGMVQGFVLRASQAIARLSGLAAQTIGCSNAPLPDPVRDMAYRQNALGMPEIQNDFIGAWLIAVHGRIGATEIVMLQCGLVGLMLLAAFRVVKWTPAHIRNRPAASVAAYATIGFAVMLALQWTISWSNAFGVVPVMGQPATFLSHGPSHVLLFGLPAILMPLAALRLRSALTVVSNRHELPPVPWRALVWRRRGGGRAAAWRV